MVDIPLMRRGREGTFNAEAYYQPSMLGDPWKQLRQQKQLLPPADDGSGRQHGQKQGGE